MLLASDNDEMARKGTHIWVAHACYSFTLFHACVAAFLQLLAPPSWCGAPRRSIPHAPDGRGAGSQVIGGMQQGSKPYAVTPGVRVSQRWWPWHESHRPLCSHFSKLVAVMVSGVAAYHDASTGCAVVVMLAAANIAVCSVHAR